MGLSTSLFAGISGLERHQLKLDVIGNNLANVNTIGFKSQRVLFQDMLYEILKPDQAPTAGNGGTNPSQVGVGTDLGVVDTNFNQGSFESTGIDSDMAIDGSGFFVLRSGSGVNYTRDGAFTVNQERKLVSPGSGMFVQGWNQTRDNTGASTVNPGGALQDVKIPIGDNRIAKQTSNVVMNGNLNGAGAFSTTGSILNSQRLFVSKSGETEISSGAVDLRNVWIKDPSGGVDNVRLFRGTGSDVSENFVLQDGDIITVQLMKGARQLDAAFVYGDPDLVNNTSGDLGPDGVPDPALKNYDGKTLNDFTRWFNYAFGLNAVEDRGVSADSNAAHAVDGDNPNDLVDMGKGGANPFTDETDGGGFSLVLSARGASNISGKTSITATVPKVAIKNSNRQFDLKGGSAADVGVGNSYVDMDGDGKFIKAKDLVLEGVKGYVVTGNSTVSQGSLPYGSANLDFMLRPLFDNNGLATADMYIDIANQNGLYDKGIDPIVRGAFSSDIFGSASTQATGGTIGQVSATNTKMQISYSTTGLRISRGMIMLGSAAANPTVYTVESATEADGATKVIFDKAIVLTDMPTGWVRASKVATTNTGVTATAAFPGTAGNSTTVTFVAGAANAISTSGSTVTATFAAGATKQTIMDLINADSAAKLVVSMSVTAAQAATAIAAETISFAAGGLATTGAAPLTYQGAALVEAGYTATTSSATGQTLITDLNAPVAITHPITGLYVGKEIYNSVVDNEKGMAGAEIINGDVTYRVELAPARLTFVQNQAFTVGTTTALTVDMVNNSAITATSATLASLGLRTGMTYIGANSATKYTIEKLVINAANTVTVTFDKAVANLTDFGDLTAAAAATRSQVFSGFAYMDTDNDGSLSEKVYRMHSTTASGSGDLFIDLDYNGVNDNTDLTFLKTTTLKDLSAYADNQVVFVDPATGKVYRKVPIQNDTTNRTVYLDKLGKGSYDEELYDIVNAGGTATGTARWVVDEDRNGKAGTSDTTVISIKDGAIATGTVTNIATDTATLNMASGSSIDGVRAGSSRIQIRGNIGTVNQISQLSFISGTDKTERNVFQNSALTNGTDHASSVEKSADGESVTQTIVIYDSLGQSHDVALTFVLESKDNDKSTWRWLAETPDASQRNGFFPAGDPRGKAPAINVGSGKLVFDNFGRFLRAEQPSPALISIPLEGQSTKTALEVKPDFSVLTAFASAAGSQVDVREQDGFAQGVMDRFSVDANGRVTGIYTNGLREVVAQVALAAFANPDGLVRQGSNLYTVSSSSGNAMVGTALSGERGAIRAKALEQSNVDITTEFTNLIITQRSYQANSRVITKSDELLQELLQVVR